MRLDAGRIRHVELTAVPAASRMQDGQLSGVSEPI